MKKEVNPTLFAEYRDPLRFVDSPAYQKMRKRYIKQALLFIATGIVFIGILLLPGGNARSPGMAKGSFVVALLAFGLPLWGICQLLTLRRSMVQERRSQLIWLHPELKALVPSHKSRKLPPMGTRLVFYAVFIVVVVLGVTAWALTL